MALNIYNNTFMNHSGTGGVIYDTGIPFYYKFVILLDPAYFSSLSGFILGGTNFNSAPIHNNTGGYFTQSATFPTLFLIPSLFDSPLGYVEIYIIQFVVLAILMYITAVIRKRLV